MFLSVAYCADAGLLGNKAIEALQKVSRMDSTLAIGIVAVVSLLLRTYVLSPIFERIPTKRRKILGKAFWGIVSMLLGEEAKLRNYIGEELDKESIEETKARLKRKYPILSIEPFKK
jgi:hypothetical protein